MRILMFGRGAIATIYGRVLQHQGMTSSSMLVRIRRRMALIDARRRPLDRRVHETFRTTLRESLTPEGGFDLIVLSVAHHRLGEAAAFLAPRVGDATLLVFGSIWEEPLAAVAPLPADQVVFGFPLAGGGFDNDGVLHAALFGSVTVGTAAASPSRRELDVKAAFRQAGLSVREKKDMRGWLWLHFISDAGVFAQAVRSGSMANMIGDRQAFTQAFLGTRELLPVLEARGVDLRPHRSSLLPYRLPRLMATITAWSTTRIPITRVSLAAHTDPNAPEPRAVLEDTKREARRLNIPTPRLKL